jgi:hypothetical protein
VSAGVAVERFAWLFALGLLGISLAAAPALPEESASGEVQAAAPEEPKRGPITSIGGSVPAETPQQRLERFKREKGAGSDKPFEGFATEAEREMQRRRDSAIAGSGVAAGGGATNPTDASLEAEILKDDAEAAENRAKAREQLEDRIAKHGPAWGPTTCFTEPQDWSTGEDLIRHRPLTRGDFLSQKQESSNLAVRVPNSVVAAYVALNFSCELQPRIEQVREGLWAAEVSDVTFYAILSRKSSWWNDTLQGGEQYTLGHEQLHFDLAEAFMRWLNQNRAQILSKLRGTGKSPQEATGNLQFAWSKLMLAVSEDFDAIETAYDRETKHGTVLDQQTFWSWRAKDGFAAISKTVRLQVRKYVK